MVVVSWYDWFGIACRLHILIGVGLDWTVWSFFVRGMGIVYVGI